jgi:hypothetical protein
LNRGRAGRHPRRRIPGARAASRGAAGGAKLARTRDARATAARRGVPRARAALRAARYAEFELRERLAALGRKPRPRRADRAHPWSISPQCASLPARRVAHRR